MNNNIFNKNKYMVTSAIILEKATEYLSKQTTHKIKTHLGQMDTPISLNALNGQRMI